ncbi:unnamed protein product [Ectocarpus fasciculatus]
MMHLDDRNVEGKGRKRGEQTTDLVNPSISKLLALSRRSNDWRGALRVLDEVEQQAAARGEASWRLWCRQGLSRGDGERARTRVYNIVMDILSSRKSSRWQESFFLLETMQGRGVTTDLFALNSALKACRSAGQVELLLALLNEMRPTSQINGGNSNDKQSGDGTYATSLLPVPDVVSFNIALGACARAGETSLAVSLFDEMRTGAVADSSRAGGAEAVGVLDVGESTARTSPTPTPNRLSYNSTLSACGRGVTADDSEWLQRALDIMEAMRTGEDGAPSPDIISYKEVVNACGRAGRWDQALSWVDAAVDAGLELTTSVFCAIIIAFGRGGEWRRSLSVLYEDMPSYGVIPDKFCYNMALRACAEAGQVKEALDILDHNLAYQGGWVNPSSYSAIIDALARQGDAELGLGLLREIEGSTGYSPNAWHYGGVFLSFLKAGDETGALAIQSEWRHIQAREATERMRRGADGFGGANGYGSERRSRNGRTDPSSDKNGARTAQRGWTKQDPEGQRAVVELAAAAPGDRFQPLDLLCLAAFHADNGAWSDCLDVLGQAQEVSRTARAAVRAKANELLLGRTERGEVVGNVGATTVGVAGAGLASWRQVAAENSEATERADEASKALRSCYESAVEALGRAGRHKEALQASFVLEEGASVAVKHGLSVDPACFVSALRSCCCNGTDSRVEAGAAMLGEMEARAGVVPDAWCTNVVMEAAVRDEQWSLASRLFDQAEERHTKGRQDRCRGEGMGGDNAVEDKSQRLAGTPGESDVRPYDRGRRELRKTAIDTMAPTALTYRLALQACVGAAPLEGNMAERALELVRKMASDPHMSPSKESFLLAKQVCAKSAGMAVAVDIRRLETEAQDKHENDDFLRQWRERRRNRLNRAPSRRSWWGDS